MSAAVVVQHLSDKYFCSQGFGVRVDNGASSFPWVLVRVVRQETSARLFGLRFVDYPLSPPTLRFWLLNRWDDGDFVFDFTSPGDPGTGTTTSPLGIATMCIPYHVDYYRNGWHNDNPWAVDMADVYVAELVHNILRRS